MPQKFRLKPTKLLSTNYYLTTRITSPHPYSKLCPQNPKPLESSAKTIKSCYKIQALVYGLVCASYGLVIVA